MEESITRILLAEEGKIAVVLEETESAEVTECTTGQSVQGDENNRLKVEESRLPSKLSKKLHINLFYYVCVSILHKVLKYRSQIGLFDFPLDMHSFYV